MSHFDKLRSKALQNYGIVTSAVAADLGLRTNELVRFCQDGRLIRAGYGVYRLGNYTPTKLTKFAETIALVGEESYVYGRSALILMDLLPYEAGNVCIATAQRVRRTLPEWIELKKSPRKYVYIEYGGIPTQSPADALEACIDQLAPDQLEAVASACSRVEFIASVQRQAVLDLLSIPTR